MAETTSNLNLVKLDASDYVSVNSFNENYDTLDKLGIDYITAEGDSGDWHYRKWKSGWAELWGRHQGITSKGAASYNWSGKFPFSLASSPYLTASAGVEGRVDAYVQYASTYDGNTVDIYVRNNSSRTDLKWWINVYISGKTTA